MYMLYFSKYIPKTLLFIIRNNVFTFPMLLFNFFFFVHRMYIVKHLNLVKLQQVPT